MRAREVVLLFVFGLLVGACGGSDRAQTLEDDSASVEAQAATDEATLKAALLTIEDLPTGWTTAPEDEDDDESPAPCGKEPTEKEAASVGLRRTL